MPNSKGAKGQGAACILGNFIFIIIIKHINNVTPGGRENFTLRYSRMEAVKKKKPCAAAYLTACLWEMIETDVGAMAPSFQDSAEIDGCLSKALKQLLQ